MIPSATACLVCLVVGMLGGVASAQPAPLADPLGPVRCFANADNQLVARFDAIQLCTGAINEAPANCYKAAETALDLSNRELVRLCEYATSTAPASCAAQIADTTDHGNSDIAEYCAARQWPTANLPTSGSPDCVDEALARTQLWNDDALRLCRGSDSTGPIECYAWGRTNLNLSDENLIQLCAAVAAYPLPQTLPNSNY